MGIIRKAVCECGFESDKMLLGGGRHSNGKVNYLPYYCKDCKSIFNANRYDDTIVCKNCKSNNCVSYENEYTIKDFATEGAYGQKNKLCPQCDNFTLEFVFVGRWD